MRIHMLAAGVLLVLGVASTACDEKLEDLTGPTPNLQPTLSSIQREIFNTTDSSGRQACANCHTSVGRNPSGLMDLRDGAAYASLVGVTSPAKPGAVRVIPGDPENSYIIHKLEGRAGIVGTPMPRGNTLLTPGQILVIKRWIELGARND
ncbi:MAG TPA: hypothetical protein VHJ58_09445 [Vicinamibacterales bacterium]|nr:hypothetical protein [Vicinamibacterales bacterium]